MSKGYGSTTIADIARAAGVAVETVYAAFRNKQTVLRQVWYVSFRGDEEDIRLWDRPEIRAVIAEPDLARRFKAQAAVYPAVFRRITPLLLMQGAVASQPDAAALLAEFDELRLDAAAKYARRQLPPASWRSARTSAVTCCGRLWTAPCGISWWPNARMVGRAVRGLAGPVVDLRIGHRLDPGCMVAGPPGSATPGTAISGSTSSTGRRHSGPFLRRDARRASR